MIVENVSALRTGAEANLGSSRRTLRSWGDKSGNATRILEELCDSLGSGEKLPTLAELMATCNASQRTVLRALDELARRGRISRRHGVGIFVAEINSMRSSPIPSLVESRSIVVLTRPDGALLDQSVEILFRQAAALGYELIPRFVDVSKLDRLNPADFGRPAGFIVLARPLFPFAQLLRQNGSRVVVLGGPEIGQQQPAACVYSSHEIGAYLTTKYLIEIGHRRIAYTTALSGLVTSRRWRGHTKALREAESHGIEVAYELPDMETLDGWGADPVNATTYFRRENAPTALACWNDRQASIYMSALLNAGLRIPDEISVIGYDNLSISTELRPHLTTIDTQIELQLSTAIDLLIEDELPESGAAYIFAPSIVIRDSTAPPHSWKSESSRSAQHAIE